MNIDVNKPIELMTDEELKELEKIGQREYNRQWREKNREKQQAAVRRARIKKGISVLKEQGVS
ncbi:hypothetical protein LPB41_34360 [Thalassospira sp. MA62]|nr:hypothetical protein [Thalassospira sp. MA62]